MIRARIIAGGVTYLLADEPFHDASGSWVARLIGTPRLAEYGKAPLDQQHVRQIELSIANTTDDGGLLIPAGSSVLWGARVELTWVFGATTRTWVGRAQRWSQDGSGTLSMTVAEDAMTTLARPIPDEVIRLTAYPGAARQSVNTTVPTVFGGTAADPIRLPGHLVDPVTFRFLLCVGEIRQVVRVLRDRSEITAGFTVFLGVPGQAVYPGFAFVQFSTDPRDAAGRWPEVHADIVGLRLGITTEAESRNPARVLQHLLTAPATGPGGWGLGIPVGDLDSASFASAISACDANGFRLDGILSSQRPARDWIEEILRTCRGEITRTPAGLWGIRIDGPRSAVMTFGERDMRVTHYGRGSASERINRAVLDYRFDATDGTLLGTQVREDTASISAIGANERRVQALLIRDHATAGMIADYILGAEQHGEQRIEFETSLDCTSLAVGNRITIDRPDMGLPGAAFAVTSITPSDFITTIEARGYSDAIFGTTPPATPADPVTNTVIPAATAIPPAAASGLALSTGITVQSDGTSIAHVTGTYTPGSRTLFTTIEWGLGAVPASWSTLTHDDTGIFHLRGLPVGTAVSVRLVSVNVGGRSSAITGTITTGADTVAPGVPLAPIASVFFRSIRVRCFQNATRSPDLAGFRVFRNTTNVPGTATEIGFVDCAGHEDGVIFLDDQTAYGTTYWYWTRAVDRTGNASALSAASGAVTTAQVGSGDISAGSISAGHIAAGAVTTDRLAAGAVTADRLAIGASRMTRVRLTATGAASCFTVHGCLVLNGALAQQSGWRGITGHVYCAATHAFVCSLWCDTWAFGYHAQVGFGNWLNTIPGGMIVFIHSQDTITRSDHFVAPTLAHALIRMGASGIVCGLPSHTPYALIGCCCLGEGNGLEQTHQHGVCIPISDISTWWIDSEIIGFRTSVSALTRIRTVQIADGAITAPKVVAGAISIDTHVSDGTSFRRTTINEATGAGRAFSALDASNALVTRVIPTAAVAPVSAGLYLGSNMMGFHDGGAWRTYMDNAGRFFLSGVGGCGLAWDGVALTVCGTVCATAGCIAGFSVTCNWLFRDASVDSGGLRREGRYAIFTGLGVAEPTFDLQQWAMVRCATAPCLQHLSIFCTRAAVNTTPACGTCLDFRLCSSVCDMAGVCRGSIFAFQECTAFFAAHPFRFERIGLGCTLRVSTTCHQAFEAFATGNIAVSGCAPNGSCGVFGCARCFAVSGCSTEHVGVQGTAPQFGVAGHATSSVGVQGYSVGDIGVRGIGTFCGVQGCARQRAGVHGHGVFGCGVVGTTGGADVGVLGCAWNCGVAGWGSNAVGVFGRACHCGTFGCGVTCCAVMGNTAYGIVSERQHKVGIRCADCVLCDLRRLPVYRYSYHDRNLRGHSEHIGPMAEEFQVVFGLGFDNRHLPQADGIALAAVKELDTCVAAIEARLHRLESRLEAH